MSQSETWVCLRDRRATSRRARRHLLPGAVQERRSQDTADPFDRDVPGIRPQDQEGRLDNRILAGGHSEGDVEAARRVQVRSKPVAWMEYLAENPHYLASALFQIGDDDADLKRRGSGVRLAFQDPARPFSGGSDFSAGVGQANANRIARNIGVFAVPDCHPAPCEGVDQPLLCGRSFMKSRELDCFRDRDFTPFNEIRDNRRQFRVREPTLSRQRPRNATAQAWKASESAESPTSRRRGTDSSHIEVSPI